MYVTREVNEYPNKHNNKTRQAGNDAILGLPGEVPTEGDGVVEVELARRDPYCGLLHGEKVNKFFKWLEWFHDDVRDGKHTDNPGLG